MDVLGPTGKRAHVLRVMDDTQAAVVRRLFSGPRPVSATSDSRTS